MYNLIVYNKGVLIINKTLSKDECESIKTTGIQWVCDAFTKYIGINIKSYTIRDFVDADNSFLINIREEDLIKLRENKLNILLK